MGLARVVIREIWPPAPTWTSKDIPDLSGKVMLVTGGNTGVGKETVKQLLAHNAKVYLAARSQSKAEEAIRELKSDTGREPVFLQLDLSSLKSVRKAAAEFLSKERSLDVLFNNAGVMVPPVANITEDGFDLQFGTNVIGPWLFTELLMPSLLHVHEVNPLSKARIITTSSISAYMVNEVHYDLIKDSPARRKKSTMDLYNQTKFADALVSQEFARRYGDRGVIAHAVTPGLIKSDMQRHMPGMQAKIMRMFMSTVEYGALTQLYAGTADETANSNGKWFVPWAREGTPNPASLDPKASAKLWQWLEENINKT